MSFFVKMKDRLTGMPAEVHAFRKMKRELEKDLKHTRKALAEHGAKEAETKRRWHGAKQEASRKVQLLIKWGLYRMMDKFERHGSLMIRRSEAKWQMEVQSLMLLRAREGSLQRLLRGVCEGIEHLESVREVSPDHLLPTTPRTVRHLLHTDDTLCELRSVVRSLDLDLSESR
jgi:hypothetical protein